MAQTDLIVRVLGDTTRLRQGLSKANNSLNRFEKKIGKVGAAFGVAFGGAIVVQAIGQSIRKIADLELQMDKVQAISGATGKSLIALKNNALELGGSTKFTATEIAKMQEEMARLGFTSSQIIQTTDAVRKLATVADAELGESAKVMVATLNSFNLEASESERVANVMAESFAKSALDIEKFNIAMANVGAVGAIAGFSVEQVTAMLGILVDRGIDASKAGTDLRKIFTELSVRGLTLEDALEKISGSTNKVETAFDLFGQRALGSGIILAENTEAFNKLNSELSDTNTELGEMVGIMEDNLDTDLKLLSSAIDGLIQKGSVLNGIFRGLVQTVTELAKGNFTLDQSMDDIAQKAIQQSQETKRLKAIQNTINAAFDSGNVEAYIRALDQNINKEEIIAGIRARQAKDQKILDDLRLQALKKQSEELAKQKLLAQVRGMAAPDSTPDKRFTSAPVIDNSEAIAAQERMAASIQKVNLGMQQQADLTNGLMVAMTGMKSVAIDMNMVMEGFAETMAVSFGTALGDAISGVGNFGASMLGAVGGFMQQLGTLMITTAIATEKFKKALIASPGVALAAGIALVAVGRAFQNQASSMTSSMGGGGYSSYGSSSGSVSSRSSGNTVGIGQREAQQVEVNVIGMVKGPDLQFVLEKNARNRGITG